MGSFASDAPPKICQFNVSQKPLPSLTGLIVNTTDIKTFVALPESCMSVSILPTSQFQPCYNIPFPFTVIDVTSPRFCTGVAEPVTDVARAPATAAMAMVFMVIVVYVSDGIDSLVQVVAREELFVDKGDTAESER